MSKESGHNTRAERTRTALVAAGRSLFATKAIDAVSIDDIVQAANVSKGSFYNHFEDRESLVAAISNDIRATVEKAIDLANAQIKDPAYRVARGCSTYLRFALDDPEGAGFLARNNTGGPYLSNPLNKGLVEDISKGLKAHRFAVPTVESGVLLVLGVSQVVFARLVGEAHPALAVSLSQQLMSLLLRGLGVPAVEAEQIAAQSAEDIVRVGVLGDALKPPTGMPN